MTKPLDDNHPFLIRGRSHARDTMEAAARIVRTVNEAKKADACQTLSTSLQLVLTTALVDGYEPHEVYESLADVLSWSMRRLPESDRIGVLTEMVKSVVDRSAAYEDALAAAD